VPSRDYIQKLADQRYEGETLNAVKAAITQIADETTLVELERLIKAGDVEGVVQLVSGKVPAAFEQVRDAELAAMAVAGRETMQIVPPRKTPNGRVAVSFKPGNQRAVERVDQLHTDMIREVSEDTRETIRDELRTQLDRGENPRTAARRIKKSIGLTRHQADIARRARERLESGDPQELRKYLGMKQRDRRFDGSVVKMIKDGTPLGQDRIDKMADAYTRKSVQNRAETIARDQSLAALDSGQSSAIDQAVSEDVIREEDVLQEWVHSRDSRVRDAHRAVPAMNRGGIRRGQTFNTPLGPLQKPRDRGSPGSVPGNLIQCRCTMIVRIKDSAS